MRLIPLSILSIATMVATSINAETISSYTSSNIEGAIAIQPPELTAYEKNEIKQDMVSWLKNNDKIKEAIISESIEWIKYNPRIQNKTTCVSLMTGSPLVEAEYIDRLCEDAFNNPITQNLTVTDINGNTQNVGTVSITSSDSPEGDTISFGFGMNLDGTPIDDIDMGEYFETEAVGGEFSWTPSEEEMNKLYDSIAEEMRKEPDVISKKTCIEKITKEEPTAEADMKDLICSKAFPE